MSKSIGKCEGHDDRTKAEVKCPNCGKLLCLSCFDIHLSIYDDCKKKVEESRL